ncbi:hypothetical protein ACFL38_04955, partial [Candidatus Omnitrophota bacterium]
KRSYRLYVGNPSGKNYPRVAELVYGYSTEEERLLGVRRVVIEQEKGALPSHSCLLLESGNVSVLNTETPGTLDLYSSDDPKPHTRSFRLPEYGSGYATQELPLLEEKGIKIEMGYVGRGRSGPTLYTASHLRKSAEGKLTEVFHASKKDIFNAIRIAVEKTDSVIKKDDFEKGEILADVDHTKSYGQSIKFLSEQKPWLTLFSLATAVYFFVTELGDGTVKLEITDIYAGALKYKSAKKYQVTLMERVRAELAD